MKSSSGRIPLYPYVSKSGINKIAFIEIANDNKGGEGSWEGESSIRKTVIDAESGSFDRMSSYELPTRDITRIVQEGANDDVFSIEECRSMIEALSASLQRI
ncbi:hypothetical protein LX64_02051 [Chitinophaga skermanii]|uniref:Uncharacterized protein n=1 Tax=Chitinophaga skermanii TaxID=331697 RepID=A0A327QU42_9BACT|nr:hypothetical protein [Chitinophaga skermanii]RAJ06923.1 hypothetical protein LX64_02051 [Chitinophaga skermanii]